MNKENNPDNSPLKYTDISKEKRQKVKETLNNTDGLYELLRNIVCKVGNGEFVDDEFSDDKLSTHLKKLAGHMADNKETEKAVKDFLSHEGEGCACWPEGTNIVKGDLLWVLIDELRDRLEKKQVMPKGC